MHHVDGIAFSLQVEAEAFGEMLPRADNRVTLSKKKDKWGIPLLHIDCTHGDNDLKIAARATRDAVAMLEAAGFVDIKPASNLIPPGTTVHEMGTVRMGRDPATSVLNGFNQAHDVPNLFVTDGSCMTTSGCTNPSLTYMAFSARAANYAADLLAAQSAALDSLSVPDADREAILSGNARRLLGL